MGRAPHHRVADLRASRNGVRFPFVAAPGWWVGAQCRTERLPVAVFFEKERAAEARPVCYRCPVRYRCLTEHLEEDFGLWGGHTRDERARIRAAIDRGISITDASRYIDDRRARRGTRPT